MSDRPVKRLPLPPQMRWQLMRIEAHINLLQAQRTGLIDGYVLAHGVDYEYTAVVDDNASIDVTMKEPNPPNHAAGTEE